MLQVRLIQESGGANGKDCGRRSRKHNSTLSRHTGDQPASAQAGLLLYGRSADLLLCKGCKALPTAYFR